MGPILEELVGRKIPLFLKDDWELIYSILADFPKLVLVLPATAPGVEIDIFALFWSSIPISILIMQIMSLIMALRIYV